MERKSTIHIIALLIVANALIVGIGSYSVRSLSAAPPSGKGQFAPSDAFYLLTQPNTSLPNAVVTTPSGGMIYKILNAQPTIICGATVAVLPGETFIIPANLLGTNKGLKISGIINISNIGARDSIYYGVSLGGHILFKKYSSWATGLYPFEVTLFNRNSTDTQASFSLMLSGDIVNSEDHANIGSMTATIINVDTTVDQLLTIQCQDSTYNNSEGNDAANIELLTIELLP